MEFYAPHEPPPKRTWVETNVRLATAAIALAAALLSFFGRSQKAVWIISSVAAVVLLWYAAPELIRPVRSAVRWYQDRRYVAREHARLRTQFQRLGEFTTRDDTRGFRYILYSAAGNRSDVIEKLIGTDFIDSWMSSSAMRLDLPCTSYREFLSRAREFTSILNEFVKRYVIKVQETPLELPKSDVEHFEAFRERFHHYLYEVEQWADSVSQRALKRLPMAEFTTFAPHRSFDRAKAFKVRESIKT